MLFRRAQRRFLSRIDLAAVEAAIRDAERSTTGEIRVAVLPRLRGRLEKAAKHAAARFGMTGTRERNGVLILVDPARRKFLVWGDTAIHEKSGAAFWTTVAAVIEERFREDDFTGGLRRGIAAVGRELATHFPVGPAGHRDQLPDRVETS
jgi:uncharacterized membrane protein